MRNYKDSQERQIDEALHLVKQRIQSADDELHQAVTRIVGFARTYGYLEPVQGVFAMYCLEHGGVASASFTADCPLCKLDKFELYDYNDEPNAMPTPFDTLDEARGAVLFDKLTSWSIWYRGELVESAAPLAPSGYDYRHQAWVENGHYIRCAHGRPCDCYGTIHHDEPVAPDADVR